MQNINYHDLKENLPALIEQIAHQHEPLCLELPNSLKAIILSEEDYSSLMETLYLLTNPVNVEILLKAANRYISEAIEWQEVKN